LANEEDPAGDLLLDIAVDDVGEPIEDDAVDPTVDPDGYTAWSLAWRNDQEVRRLGVCVCVCEF
jgi:hypothetical protein